MLCSQIRKNFKPSSHDKNRGEHKQKLFENKKARSQCRDSKKGQPWMTLVQCFTQLQICAQCKGQFNDLKYVLKAMILDYSVATDLKKHLKRIQRWKQKGKGIFDLLLTFPHIPIY